MVTIIIIIIIIIIIVIIIVTVIILLVVRGRLICKFLSYPTDRIHNNKWHDIKFHLS